MYHHIRLKNEIIIKPRIYGPQLLEQAKQKLTKKVEGRCSAKYGLLVTIREIKSVSILHTSTNFMALKLKYEAIVFRPFVNQILYAEVVDVEKVGLYAVAGPISCFISRHAFPGKMRFYENFNSPCYISDIQNREISINDTIRMKIVSVRIVESQILVNVTVLDDCLTCESVHSYIIEKTNFDIHVR